MRPPMKPLVSVVIPTRGRPHLVLRAIRCALRQTEQRIEVVVVIDGPDAATEAELDRIADSRLLRVSLEEPVGGAEARNVGVRAARGDWIALLDDDDEWLPNKLAAQLEAAQAESANEIVVVCKYVVRSTNAADVVRPRRLPRPGEPVSDYMFDYLCYFQTSTFFSSRDFFLKVPFQKDLPCFHDIDWFLRATTRDGVKLVVVPEALSIYHAPEERTTITSKLGWESRLAWGRANRHRMTRRAYTRFISGSCAGRAVQDKAGFRGLSTLLQECIFGGSPTLVNVALILGIFLVPPHLRRRIRDAVFLSGHKAPALESSTSA
jgi:glycosyltransferase involved in cell wall biosynthesis